MHSLKLLYLQTCTLSTLSEDKSTCSTATHGSDLELLEDPHSFSWTVQQIHSEHNSAASGICCFFVAMSWLARYYIKPSWDTEERAGVQSPAKGNSSITWMQNHFHFTKQPPSKYLACNYHHYQNVPRVA